MREINEGAEAKIYRLRILGREAVAKLRISKAYRIPELDENLRYRRTRNEARILATLSGKIKLPELLLAGKYTIYMSYINGNRLSDMKADDKGLPKCLADSGTMLATMHNENVTHGDFTPANLMEKGGEVYIIDFGLSYSTASIEDKALDLLLMRRSVSPALYRGFLNEYKKASKDSEAVIERLAGIERRGRYQTRTLAAQSEPADV